MIVLEIGYYYERASGENKLLQKRKLLKMYY